MATIVSPPRLGVSTLYLYVLIGCWNQFVTTIGCENKLNSLIRKLPPCAARRCVTGGRRETSSGAIVSRSAAKIIREVSCQHPKSGSNVRELLSDLRRRPHSM